MEKQPFDQMKYNKAIQDDLKFLRDKQTELLGYSITNLFAIVTILVLTLLLSSNAFSATTGSVTLSGHVPSATNIVVTPQNNYNNLDLSVLTTDYHIANVREINNTAAGYTVTVASTNAGKLKNGSIGEVTYTSKYNGTGFTLSTTPQTVTTQGAQTGVVNVLKQVVISYPATALDTLMTGYYTDTLTFTIIAN